MNPQKINPYAIKTMREIGIDISNQSSKKINFNNLSNYEIIITLCGDALDKCPILERKYKHLHWNLEDPAKLVGSKKEITLAFSKTRDVILKKIKQLKI